MLQFLLTQIGKLKSSVSGLNTKTQTQSQKITDNVYAAKCANVVTLSVRGWTAKGDITVPEGYRPGSQRMFIAEQQGLQSGSYGRLTINSDGSVSCDGTNLIGTFTWIID